MYLEEEKKKLEILHSEKIRRREEHKKAVKGAEAELINLKKQSADALDHEDNATYIELMGKIAVAEARIKRLSEIVIDPVKPEELETYRRSLNTAYGKEMTKHVKKLEKAYAEIFAEISELESIVDEYMGLVRGVEGLIEKSVNSSWITKDSLYYTDEMSTVNSLRKLAELSIEPGCEHPRTDSLHGMSLMFSYGE